MTSFVYMDQGNHGDPSSNLVTDQNSKVLKKAKENEERLKKGEWSDDAIHDLLDAYEAKWNDRNRGNLRLGDWEDVSAHVKSRNGGMKILKTPTQCKNKIEGMKKKYRSEAVESYSNTRGNCSEWPFFSRMELMLRCPTRKAGIPGGMDAGCLSGFNEGVQNNESGEGSEARNADFFAEQSPIENIGQSLHILQQQLQREHNLQILMQNFETEQEDKGSGGASGAAAFDSDLSPSALIKNDENENNAAGAGSSKSKRLKQIQSDVAMNIKSFADSILKLEQAKMEMYKDTERLRSEAETRRAELELKRTQIIMDTQLEIAKLLSSKNRKRRGSNVCQVPKENGVVVDKTCISAVQVEKQPDLQSGNPGNACTFSEPPLRQE